MVTLRPARDPKAELAVPVLYASALVPMAVFEFPISLKKRALKPKPVFKLPVVLVKTATSPTAVFWNLRCC